MSSWKNFWKVIRQMLTVVMPENTNQGKEVVGIGTVTNLSKPHWVRPPENKLWNNVLVCDVWGLTVPLKTVGV